MPAEAYGPSDVYQLFSQLLTAVSKESNQTSELTLLTTISQLDFATQTTLASILSKLVELDAAFDGEDFATETTLQAARTLLSSLEGKVGTDASLQQILAAVDGLELSVDNIDLDMDDVESKLDTLNTKVDASNSKLDTLNSTDFSSEATLEASRVILSSLNSELALQQKDAVTDAELRASDISVDDDAAQALLQQLIDSLGTTVSANTVRELLLRIYNAVDGLELSVDNIDIDMDDVETLLANIESELSTQQKDALTDTELRASPVPVEVNNPTADPETGLAKEATLATLAKEATLTTLGKESTLTAILDELVAAAALEVTERMLTKRPSLGYRLWFDTTDPAYIYTMEAPAGTSDTSTGFRGIRIPLLAGNPVGAVEVNLGGTLTFANRSSDAGWSA